MAENKNLTTKEAFAEEVSKAITDALGNVTVATTEVKKLNEKYLSLVVKPEDGNVGMNANVDSLYEKYLQGVSFEKLCAHIIALLKDAMANMPTDEAIDMITNYEEAKKHLVVEVVSAEANKDLLETIPHKDIEDMAVVYRIDTEPCLANGSVLVTNHMLETYGVTLEELHKDALKYAPVNKPLQIRTLAEVLGVEADLLGVGTTEDYLLVASVPGDIHGAGVLAYEEFLDKAAERIGGSFYLLPSSIHELLIVADRVEETMDLTMLEEMVRQVNETTVDPTEKLTDSVYHYDAKDKIFELGTKYIIRHAENKEDIA